MALDQLTQEIEVRLDLGSNLDRVEAELIEPADHLDEDERAALWLFAWSYGARGSDDAIGGRSPAHGRAASISPASE